MSRFYSIIVLTLSLLLSSCSDHSLNTKLPNEIEVVVYEGETMKIVVPEYPLAPGSVEIIPNTPIKNFSEWKSSNELETYKLIKDIAQVWEKSGVTDYLVYGKESAHSKSTFGWEVIPYKKEGWRSWKQFKVLWNMTFGSSYASITERLQVAKDFQKEGALFSQPLIKQIEAIKEVVKGNDVFCNPKVIEKQLVFEGKSLYVVYNYAPIAVGEGKLHFLLIPKQHHVKFTDLTPEEYLEANELSQKLINFYKSKGYHTVYLYNKTGAEAGQSVFHWHEHLVFTSTETEEFLSKLVILKNMVFRSSPLPEKEVQERVESLRKELVPALEK